MYGRKLTKIHDTKSGPVAGTTRESKWQYFTAMSFVNAVMNARRTLSDARRTLSDARRTLSDARRTLSDARRALSDARRALSDARRTLSNARCTLSNARRTLSNVPAAEESVLGSTRNFEDSNASTNVPINDSDNDEFCEGGFR